MAKIYKHNKKGEYCNFYGLVYPHIIELVLKNSNTYNRVWTTIELYINSKVYNLAADEFYLNEFGFFNKVIFYNEKQCSGELNIEIRNTKEEDLFEQVNQSFETNINKVGGIWYITDFRDYVVLKDKPIFSKDWNSIKDYYPIDKVVNTTNYGTDNEPLYVIDSNKDWTQLENFKDKYLAIRLIDSSQDKFKQLTTKYLTDQTIQYQTT